MSDDKKNIQSTDKKNIQSTDKKNIQSTESVNMFFQLVNEINTKNDNTSDQDKKKDNKK